MPALGMLAAAGMQQGMGLLNDTRQYLFQQLHNKQNLKNQKELTDYNFNKQLEMWNATGYEAQVEQMEKAGINPALMYGMGGGGGQTANVQTGNAPGGTAGRDSNDLHGIMGMQLMEAQKRVLETQADKNAAEAEKTKGTDTTESQSRTALNQVTTTLKGLEVSKESETYESSLERIKAEASKAIWDAGIASVENNIATETAEAQIAQAKEQLTITTLTQALIEAQTKNYETSSQVQKQEIALKIRAWIEQNKINWKTLDLKKLETELYKQFVEFQTNWGKWVVEQSFDVLRDFIPNKHIMKK